MLKSMIAAISSENEPNANGFWNAPAFFCPRVTRALPMAAMSAIRKGANSPVIFIVKISLPLLRNQNS